MESYRIEVGRDNNVQPGNIVGAIANEAGISSQSIGKISIFERFSTVDLPVGMPPAVMHRLSNAYVGGRKLRISPVAGNQHRSEGPSTGKHRFPPAKAKPKHRKRTANGA